LDQFQKEDLACRIWEQLKNAHAGNTQVQAQLFATYRREYEYFTHLPGESIDAMFQRLTVIVNNMRANVVVLPYDDHDKAIKLLHSLNCTMWSRKVEAILESEKFETLTVDELFSKLKSSEVDRGVHAKVENPTDPHSLALMSGSRTNANMSLRHFSLSCLVSMTDEEFDVLGEEDLALLSRWFERMYTNRKNSRRSSGTCYQCGKHELFMTEWPEVKPEHKHRSRTDHKHHSRDDYKGSNKSEQRPKKSGGHEMKERAMVVSASNIDSSSCYSSSSSSDEDENRHKGNRSSKNINDMCFATQGFCDMAHSSASKKSNKDDDSYSDSEEEVNNDPSFLIAENARLNDLLENHDDVLRKTNKKKKEYRSLLGEAKEKVVELESLLVDARAQIDSLKSAPVVTNEPECTNCSVFLDDLTVLKEKYTSKVEELVVLRVELDEIKSRPSLLGACTSCPVLHEKLDVSLVYARSLEVQLKAPIPTPCSTCEVNAVKNMECVHYVDRLQDEND
jgi:hypothetical protein